MRRSMPIRMRRSDGPVRAHRIFWIEKEGKRVSTLDLFGKRLYVAGRAGRRSLERGGARPPQDCEPRARRLYIRARAS